MEDTRSKILMDIRHDIKVVPVYKDFFYLEGKKIDFPRIDMQIPGNHIRDDANLAYVCCHIV